LRYLFNTERVETVSLGWGGLAGYSYFKYGKVDDGTEAEPPGSTLASNHHTPKGDMLNYWGKK
jgi:hypothetical protein